MKDYIDVSTEEKKKSVYALFASFSCKSDIYKYYGKTDNSSNIKYINGIAQEIGFDFSYYQDKKANFCLTCGKKLHKGQKKFCSSSCSAKYNNRGRQHSEETKTKIRQGVLTNVLKRNLNARCEKQNLDCNNNVSHIKIKAKFQKTCKQCGKNFETTNANANYCSNICANIQKHKLRYKDFLEHSEKYCRGNYSPKSFKQDILKEQNCVCAICGCEPKHNGKDLVFVLDHIDGDASNNHRDNLRMICPNCDSQLSTFKSKNKNSSRRNYWKEKIIRDIINNEQN